MNQIDIKIRTIPNLDGLNKLDRELAKLGQIETFKKLKARTQEANKAWKDAEAQVSALAEKIGQAEKPTKAMVKEFDRAKQNAAKLKAEFLKQQESLNNLRTALNQAGVNTRKLGSEQKRLQVSLAAVRAEARQSAKISAARGLLEVQSYKKIRREIDQLNAAYKRLKNSGKLSMQELAQAQRNLRQKTDVLNRSMNGWTTAISEARMGLIAMTAAIYALSRVSGSIIRTFTDFDDTMRQVGAVSGATESQMQGLTNIAEEMGRKTRYSATEAAEGLKYLSMAGFRAEESIKALPGVLQLAAAGSLDLGQAADITTNVLTSFGLGVNQLGRVNDVLVKAFTSSNSTLTELGSAFSYVGPIAAGVGADFEELVATLGQLHNAGLKGSMAGTALRGAIDALLNPTDQEAELMDELSERIGGAGLQIQDANGDFIGFGRIIEQLETAGITGAEALKLFGQRAGPGMQALVNIGSQKIKEFTVDLQNSGGTADKIATQMEAGIGGAIREMKAAIEGLALVIGKDVAPVVITLAHGIRNLTTGIADADPVTRGLIYTMGAAAAGFAIWKLGLRTIAHQLPLIRAEINATTAASTRMAVAMRAFAGVAAIYGIYNIGKLAVEIYKLNKVMREHADIANKEAQAAEKYSDAKDVQIKSAEELAKLTDEERQAYLKNLAAATQYYSHLSNQANLLKDDAMLGGLLPFQSQKGKENEVRLKELSAKQREYINALMAARRSGDAVAESTGKIGRITAFTAKKLEEFENSAEKAYKNALKAVKDYEKQLAEIQGKSTDARIAMEDKLREIKQRSMDESQKQLDNEKRVTEKLTAAKKALADGDKDRAEELAKQSANIADSLENEQAAANGVKQAYEFLQKLYKTEESTLQEKLKASKKDADLLKKSLDELAQAREAKVEVSLEKFNEAKAALDRWLKEPATKVVKIKTVEQKSIGGAVGLSRGGGLPGYGGGDRINAILEAGEFVMRKEAVRRYGMGLFQRLNALSLTLPSFSIPAIQIPQVPRFAFAAGGMVAGGVKDMGKIDLQVGGKGYPVMGRVDVIEELKTALRKENLLRGNG